MSKFDESTVKKVAHLARLELTGEELKKFSGQLDGILHYIEKLNSLDTAKVEPLSHAMEPEMFLGADEVETGPGIEKMLENAPEQLYENFKVPQVLGGDE